MVRVNAYGNADEVIAAIGLDKPVDETPIETKTQPQGQQPAFDESTFINRDQFVVGLDFNAQMFDLSNEHAQLFTGVKDAKPFRASDLLAEVKKGKDPSVAFDELYGASARRADIQKAAIEAEVRTRLEAEYQAKVDALHTNPSPAHSAPANDFFTESLRANVNDKQGESFFKPPVPAGQAGVEQAREVRVAATTAPATTP
jgi:hypothetical protein